MYKLIFAAVLFIVSLFQFRSRLYSDGPSIHCAKGIDIKNRDDFLQHTAADGEDELRAGLCRFEVFQRQAEFQNRKIEKNSSRMAHIYLDRSIEEYSTVHYYFRGTVAGGTK